MPSNHSINRSRTFRRAAERAAAKNQKVGSNFSLFATSTLVAGGFVGWQAGPAFANGNDFVSCDNLSDGTYVPGGVSFDDSIAITLDGLRDENWEKIVGAADFVSDSSDLIDKLYLCKDPDFTPGSAGISADVATRVSLEAGDHLEIINASGYLVSIYGQDAAPFGFGFSQAFNVYNSYLSLSSRTVASYDYGVAFKNFDQSSPIVVDTGVAPHPSSIDISRTLFAGNSDTAIRSFYSEVSLDYTYFDDNIQNQGDGGAIYARGSTVTVNRSSFDRNEAASSGGAIAMNNSTLRVSNSEFSSSVARSVRGGAIYLGQSDLVVSSTTFRNNYSYGSGGAISAFYSQVTVLDGSEFISNSTRRTPSTYGGAIYLSGTTSLRVEDSNFEHNRSFDGGAIGSRFDSSEEDVIVDRSTFNDNIAEDDGGAIHVYGGNLQSTLEVSRSEFTDNTAGGYGGAIYLRNMDSFVEQSLFFGNSADFGGGVYAQNPNLLGYFVDIARNSFIANEALFGSAIYSFVAFDLTITNNTFTDNQISGDANRGGDVQVLTSHVDFNTFAGDSLWVSNTGPWEGQDVLSHLGTTVFSNIFTSAMDFRTTGDIDRSSERQENVFIDEEDLEYFAGDSNTLPHFKPFELSAAADFRTLLEVQARLPIFVVEIMDSRDQIGELRTDSWTAGSIQATFEGGGGDVTPPTLSSSSPADNSTGVSVGSNIVLTFSEDIFAGTGNIVIRKANGEVIATIPIGSGQVTISGNTVTIDPTSNLEAGTDYYIEIANGVLEDVAGNPFAGISGATTLNFSTEEQFGFLPPFTGPPVTTDPGTSTPGSIIAKKVVPGFAANSVKLTASMRAEIRKFVKANPGATTVTCKGFTSSPATAIDLRLARQRGQAVCDLVKKLNPDITVRVIAGSHNNEPGNQIRRARIVLR